MGEAGNQPLICVYASSSMHLEKKYHDEARALGKAMAENGYGLCFGGGARGLMGAVADEVLSYGGSVVGVIPEALHVDTIVHTRCSELIVTATMRERKRMMEERSLGFIALPGGFGTLEELLEMITLKQLGYHQKPIVILNFNGFYDKLLEQFMDCTRQGFIDEEGEKLFAAVQSAAQALEYIKSYCPPALHYGKLRASAK